MCLAKKLTNQALDLLAMTPEDTEERLETLESAIVLLECASGRVNVTLGGSPVIPKVRAIDWKAIEAWIAAEDDCYTIENCAIVARDTSKEG